MLEKKMTSLGFLWGVFFCACGLVLAMADFATAAGKNINFDLSNTDCAKCHEREPREIALHGMGHSTGVTCKSCHQGHRPKTPDNIPVCSDCHSGTPHFGLENCQSCHNPHAPLNISLKGELKEVCLSCHEPVGQELAENPSMHGEMACNFCHAEKHPMVPQCVECHEPHSGTMSQADCNTCHKAHMPTSLNWGPETPSVHCAACHEPAFEQLRASETPHGKMECVFCHGEKHKYIPACADCHGLPHAEGMHQKFPGCSDCHNVAHDLNNWSGNGKNKQ